MGLDSVELILRIEEEFDVEIADDEASAIVTVGDLYKCLVKKWDAKSKSARRSAREPTWQTLCDVIVDEQGVQPERITPNAEIVKGLGID